MKKATNIFILAALFIIIIYDVYAYAIGGTAATISWIIYQASKEMQMIPFAAGVLCGHFFWQMRVKGEDNGS